MKTKKLILALVLTFFISESFGEGEISGVVCDKSGTPLQGVIVIGNHHSRGVRTDIDGGFQLNKLTSDTLIFVYPGMEMLQIPIDGQQLVNVNMISTVRKEQVSENSMVQSGGKIGLKIQSFRSVSKSVNHPAPGFVPFHQTEWNTEEYNYIKESGFHQALVDPLSTFSADVDRASYTNVRRFINNGSLPPIDAVRVEEIINYFEYDLNEPEADVPLNVSFESGVCPWNNDNRLVFIGLQAKRIDLTDLPPSNLVFLIDVSGSMSARNKLPLVKSSLRMLTNNLRPQDKVAIVVYAGAAGEVLPATPGSNKNEILEAIENLQAGGSTAGGEGLSLAYRIASKNYMEKGNNRVILASDGDFNVGISSESELQRMVEVQRIHGIGITVLGFGMGNYKDNKLEAIANNGDGNYHYIDNSQEAQKVLIKEFGATLFTIARDVKLQVEFNPDVVESYRLVGYENRELANHEFDNEKTDAGELGAGHQMVALYEIVPRMEEGTGESPLKYQKRASSNREYKNEMLSLKVRYKEVNNDKQKELIEILQLKSVDESHDTSNLKQAALLAGFGMLLRDSEYVKDISLNELLESLKNTELNGSEFQSLLETSIALKTTSER